MPKIHSNKWHRTLYGQFFARVGLDSKARHQQATDEARFLVEALEIKAGSHILDAPCGTGRHALVLAKLGMSVTGIDISEACIKLARANCRGRQNIFIKTGDMKHLRWAEGKFDVVLNMFSSFGYFKSDLENKKVLKGFYNSIRPGGRVVIQTINRDWLLKIFDPARWGETPQYSWQEGTRYDPKTKYVEAQRIFVNKKTHRAEISYNRMRVYSISEMKSLMKEVGFSGIKVYGDIKGGQVNKFQSTHPIYVGTK